MNRENRNSIIRHACGGIVLIAVILFYPTYLFFKMVF